MEYEIEQCGAGKGTKKTASASSEKKINSSNTTNTNLLSDSEIDTLTQKQIDLAKQEAKTGSITGADSILARMSVLESISKGKPKPQDLDNLAEFWNNYSKEGSDYTKPGREVLAQYGLRIFNNTTESGRNRIAAQINDTKTSLGITSGQKAFNDLIASQKQKMESKAKAAGGLTPEASFFQTRYTTGGRSKTSDDDLVLDLL